MRKLLAVLLFGMTVSANAVTGLEGAAVIKTAAVIGAYLCGQADQKNGSCLKAEVPVCLTGKSETVKAANGNYYFDRSPKCGN
jgi:hypothetical protein